MALERFCYSASLLKVVDGDTVDLMVDLGFDVHHRIRVRLYGVNTPESRTTNALEKAAGLKAKEFAHDWMEQNPVVVIQTLKDKNEKYGRILANVYLVTDTGQELLVNKWMLTNGHAVPYDGKTKQLFDSDS